MILAREAGDEERHDLVADELVDEAVPGVHDGGSRPVEARDQPRELLRRHPLGETGRTADVREQQRELDLRAARNLLDLPEAGAAQTAVELRGPEPERLEQDAARRVQRCRAELATGSRGNTADDLLRQDETARLTLEDRAPELALLVLAHVGILSLKRGTRQGARPRRRRPAPTSDPAWQTPPSERGRRRSARYRRRRRRRGTCRSTAASSSGRCAAGTPRGERPRAARGRGGRRPRSAGTGPAQGCRLEGAGRAGGRGVRHRPRRGSAVAAVVRAQRRGRAASSPPTARCRRATRGRTRPGTGERGGRAPCPRRRPPARPSARPARSGSPAVAPTFPTVGDGRAQPRVPGRRRPRARRRDADRRPGAGAAGRPGARARSSVSFRARSSHSR